MRQSERRKRARPVRSSRSRPGSAEMGQEVAMQSTRAWVHDGVRQIEYERAGAGPTVIMLVNGAVADGARARIFAELSRTCRVICPEWNSAQSNSREGTVAEDLTDWLAGFLDALGVARASVVASDQQALSALRFALTEPDRVERIALLLFQAPVLEDSQALSDVLAHRRQSLLVLSPNGTGVLDQLGTLADFLTQPTLA